MSKEIEKLVNISDDDVEIIYRRKAKSIDTDNIHGVNIIIWVMLFVFGLISFVAISSTQNSQPTQPNTIIVK